MWVLRSYRFLSGLCQIAISSYGYHWKILGARNIKYGVDPEYFCLELKALTCGSTIAGRYCNAAEKATSSYGLGTLSTGFTSGNFYNQILRILKCFPHWNGLTYWFPRIQSKILGLPLQGFLSNSTEFASRAIIRSKEPIKSRNSIWK